MASGAVVSSSPPVLVGPGSAMRSDIRPLFLRLGLLGRYPLLLYPTNRCRNERFSAGPDCFRSRQRFSVSVRQRLRQCLPVYHQGGEGGAAFRDGIADGDKETATARKGEGRERPI